jgi:hypothetical protein
LPSWVVAQQVGEQRLSHARVVRLSYVSGTVAVKRPKAAEWAKAMVNTPIQEGYSVSTSSNSFAEVEFENGSTARLGELSEIDFTQLAMNGEGNKLNRLALEQGYATFHFLPEHGDVYEVKAAGATFTPDGKSEFRTDIDYGRLRAEVFSGSVDVAASVAGSNVPLATLVRTVTLAPADPRTRSRSQPVMFWPTSKNSPTPRLRRCSA